jgi:hypothetical protein
LKQKRPPNKYSLKKINQINAEAPIRKSLARRAHGTAIEYIERYRRNDGKIFKIHRVRCVNGICECGCNRPGRVLDPHEKHSRGRGGLLTLLNTIMFRRDCHRSAKLDKRQVKLDWIKKEPAL